MSHKSRLLRELFASKPLLRIVGAHHALGAKLAEKHGFHGVWASGLEISAAHAVPDANILTMTEHLQAASAMNEATSLPVICDCDTGYGNASNVIHMVKKYESAGLAAVVIEDKIFPKVNSFIPGRQELARVEEFMGKIEAAKNAQAHSDFMVFARVEALIAGWGLEEALKRAYAYAEAGADGIVIHSKAETPDEIFAFAKEWKASLPLVAIPTTYPQVTAEELRQNRFKMVIYANHGLRASLYAMDQTFRSIAQTGSTAAVEKNIVSMKEVFDLQGMGSLKADEEKFSKREQTLAVIPAGADHGLGADKPLCMLPVGGKTILDRQADSFRSCGVRDIVVIGGHLSDKIRCEGAEILTNPRYAESGIAASLFFAGDRLEGRFVMAFSDIVFDRSILERLLESPHAVTLVIDLAYRTLPPREKKFDLVLADDAASDGAPRRLGLQLFKPVRRIGHSIPKQDANFEFIGLAFFREEGTRALKEAWREANARFAGKPFYEAPRVEKADFTDLLQYLIDRGTAVHGLSIEHGWSEIRSLEDYRRVDAHFKGSAEVLSASP